MSSFFNSWGAHMLGAGVATLPVCFSSAWWTPFLMTLIWWLPFGYIREIWQDHWVTAVTEFTWHKHREALAWSWGGAATSVLSLSWAFC